MIRLQFTKNIHTASLLITPEFLARYVMIKIPSLYNISNVVLWSLLSAVVVGCIIIKQNTSLILIWSRKQRLTISHLLLCLCCAYDDVVSAVPVPVPGYWRPPVSITLWLVVVVESGEWRYWGLNWAVEGRTDWWNGVRGVRPENSQTTVTRPQAPLSTNTRTGAAVCWTCSSETLQTITNITTQPCLYTGETTVKLQKNINIPLVTILLS